VLHWVVRATRRCAMHCASHAVIGPLDGAPARGVPARLFASA
jgi:hypothetical protein